jgi:hypothetical protein
MIYRRCDDLANLHIQMAMEPAAFLPLSSIGSTGGPSLGNAFFASPLRLVDAAKQGIIVALSGLQSQGEMGRTGKQGAGAGGGKGVVARCALPPSFTNH